MSIQQLHAEYIESCAQTKKYAEVVCEGHFKRYLEAVSKIRHVCVHSDHETTREPYVLPNGHAGFDVFCSHCGTFLRVE